MLPLLAVSDRALAYSFNATYSAITTTTVSDGVVRAPMNNPPINLLDRKLATDLVNLLLGLNKTQDVELLDAADPRPADVNPSEVVGYYVEVTRLLSTLDTVIIAEVSGRAHGAGSEIALQCDMRLARPDALFSQFEDSLGTFPAAGAVPFLVKLIGRAKTFEYVMAAKGVDSQTAERIGWVSTAYRRADELTLSTNTLAKRIALFPRRSLVTAKRSINDDRRSEADLNKDVAAINELRVTPVVVELMTRFLELTGDETWSHFEAGMPDDLGLLYG